MPLTTPDPLAEVRAEFAAGLGQRIDTLRTALERLRTEFSPPDAETLYRAAHSLTGTAGSFGAEALAHVAGDLETLARGWLARRLLSRRSGASPPPPSPSSMHGRAGYRRHRSLRRARSPAAACRRGELTSLITAAVDRREIFQGAILKVQRVLDFRRASVVLTDDTATHYYLHTLYDRERGGFVNRDAVFPIEQGITGQAIRSGRPIRVDALPATEGILLQEGKRVSTMIVPLHVGDRVIGALNFGHEDPGRYSDEDLDWAVVLGRQIETSLYYSSSEHHRRAARGRHASTRRFRASATVGGSDRRQRRRHHAGRP